MPSPHTTLVLSAGEASGDALAAELAAALLKRRPSLRLRGLAGPKMRAAGVEAIGRVEELGVMGVAEVLGALSRVRAARAALRAALAEGPAMFVPVDAPDLHLPMIPDARRAGAKVVLYGVPQVLGELSHFFGAHRRRQGEPHHGAGPGEDLGPRRR